MYAIKEKELLSNDPHEISSVWPELFLNSWMTAYLLIQASALTVLYCNYILHLKLERLMPALLIWMVVHQKCWLIFMATMMSPITSDIMQFVHLLVALCPSLMECWGTRHKTKPLRMQLSSTLATVSGNNMRSCQVGGEWPGSDPSCNRDCVYELSLTGMI